MTSAPPLFCYRSGNTPLHRTPAGIKLVILIASTLVVFSGNAVALASASAVIALSAFVARTPFAVHARNAKIILYYGAFIVVFRFAGKPLDAGQLVSGLEASAFYVGQLAAVLLAGTVFYETTGTTDIAHTLSSVQKFLRWKRPLPDVAFLLSLTIGFMPRIFHSWNALEKAWTARGGACRKGLPGAARRIATLVPLLVINLLAVASDTDRAIRNRS